MSLKAYTASSCLFRHCVGWRYAVHHGRLSTLSIIPRKNRIANRTIDSMTKSTSNLAATVSPHLKSTTTNNSHPRMNTGSATFFLNFESSILSWAIWLIKRTYQPSILKKKRKCGYLKRRLTVGGRNIFKRRRQKGRKRLFGA